MSGREGVGIQQTYSIKGISLAEPYLERLIETIASLGINSDEGVALEYKHFFSGAALYANGNICVTLTPAGFGLKLPLESRNHLINTTDGKELRYFEKAPVKKEYVALTKAVLDDRDRLKYLIQQSIAYVII